jgi:hypothetical protein
MTQDDIIEMAKQSNLLGVIDCFHYTGRQTWVEEATAFAKLVEDKIRQKLREEVIYKWVPPHFVDLAVKEEREACARFLETTDICGDAVMDELAAAIRARGE